MPWLSAHAPISITIKRPASSMHVIATLTFTDSPTPRKLIVREADDEQRHEHDERHRRELLEIARERAARRSHRRQRRAHHGEADEERDEAAVERALRVQRGAGRARILADELEIRRGREHRDEECAAEREPRRSADASRDVARQRVDARAEHVADHEEQQELRADGSMQCPARASRGTSSVTVVVIAAR